MPGVPQLLGLLPDLVLAADASSPSTSESAAVELPAVFPERFSDISDLSRWWQHAVDFLTTKGAEFLVHVTEAIVIFIVGRWVARCLTRLISRLATQAQVDQTLVRFVCHLTHAAMLAFVVLSALNRIGIDTTSFAAVVAAAGLAIGFALQGSLANFAAGVMLIMFKPFKVGDSVTAGGSTGTIEEIQIFCTLFKTADNSTIFVPNSSITGGTIVNHSHEKVRRMDLVVKCGYDDDLREVKRFLVDLLYSDERILQLPPPAVAVDQLGDNAINLVVQPWVRSEDYGIVRANLLEAIKIGFDQRGFHPRSPTPASAGTSVLPLAKAG
jgi:small conductance mechanosensitive channel